MRMPGAQIKLQGTDCGLQIWAFSAAQPVRKLATVPLLQSITATATHFSSVSEATLTNLEVICPQSVPVLGESSAPSDLLAVCCLIHPDQMCRVAMYGSRCVGFLLLRCTCWAESMLRCCLGHPRLQP